MWTLILRVRAPEEGWCRQVTLQHKDVAVRVHSCFPLEGGSFLEEVSFEGENWRAALRDATASANLATVTTLQEERDRGRVRFLVKSCALISALRSAAALPRFPFRTTGAHDYWVFMTRQQDAQQTLAALQQAQIPADVVYSGSLDAPRGLTGRQSEILSRAVAEGYYEYPRKISLTHLAEQLKIAKSTLSEALVMVEREVVRRYVGETTNGVSGPDAPLRIAEAHLA